MAIQILEFGAAYKANELGYSVLSELFDGTPEEAKKEYAEEDVILVYGGAHFERADTFEFGVFAKPS